MIQVRLWNDCWNNCSFCSLGNKTKLTTNLSDKIIRINKLLELSDDRIGLIGGEFFEGQLQGCEDVWLNMIKRISCNELFITANLIHYQYLLAATIEARPDILICTSYDTVGRFGTNLQKDRWLSHVNSIKNAFCTIIPTQDMLNDPYVDLIQCPINLSEPFIDIDWYLSVDKEHYHDELIKHNNKFNLPKRTDFLRWAKSHKNISYLMKYYKETHFNNILKFNEKNEFEYEVSNRFDDENFMAKCGHPHFSKCYADSDKCLCCDLEVL